MNLNKYKNPLTYEDYKVDKAAYNSTEAGLLKMFEEDLADEFGMTDHPKRHLLFSKAWDSGHSSGLNDVLYWYEEMVELVR